MRQASRQREKSLLLCNDGAGFPKGRGLIVAAFMQMAWERLALICAILLPPGCLLVPVSLILKNCVNTY
jgi:hypothetical protein